jgi:hypothetical protein
MDKSTQERALEVLRAISKSSNTALQLDDCPDEFLQGYHIMLGRWTMVVSDKNMKTLSEMPTEVFSLDANQPKIEQFFWDFWEPKDLRSGLQSLDSSGSKKVTEYGLGIVARRFPGLKHLNIRGCLQIGDVGLREVGMNCEDLLSLNMSSCQAITGAGLIAVAEVCHNLLKLDISRCSNLESFGLMKVFYECKLLEEVDVSYMSIMGDDELRVLAQNCPNLVYFNAQECPFLSDSSVQLLAKNCRDLDYVDISRTSLSTRITDLALLAFGESNESLRVLKMSGCDQITDVGLTWLAEGCRVIEEIDFNGCTKISDAGLRSLGASCHALISLDVSSAKLISDVGVANLAVGCPKMKHLRIKGLYLMCDPRITIDTKKGAKVEAWQSIIGIQAVAQHMECLESIDISGCFRLNKSIQKFLSRLDTLKKINFSQCNQTTTESLIELSKGCPLLEDITLNDCGIAVNDAAFSKGFVKHCRNLHTVVVHRCLEIRGGALKALSRCPSLTKLDITGCKTITDMMFLPLTEVDTVPELKTLIIVNCPLLTDTALAWIASKTHDITLLACKGTAVTKHSVQAVRDRFEHSDKLDNDNFLGFWPKFRMEDRKLMNQYYYIKRGWIKLQARQRSWLARERVKRIVEHRRRKWAVYILQRMVKLFVAKARVFYKRRAYWAHQRKAVLITTVFHIAKAKKRVLRIKQNLYADFLNRTALLIQTRYRIMLARAELERRRAEYQEWLRKRYLGACKFQSIVRVYFAKMRVQRIKDMRRARVHLIERKSLVMQRYWRGSRGRIMAKERKAYVEWFTVRRETAAAQIQHKARVNYTNKLIKQRVAKKKLLDKSARSIQSLMRGFLCRLMLAQEGAEEFEIQQDGAATTIQCAIRRKLAYMTLARKKDDEQEKWRKMEIAAIAVQKALRCKVARAELARRKHEALELLKARVNMELWGVCKIQALFRGMRGRVRYAQLVREKKGKWKELYDPEKQRRFFYNKLTGEIRWRIPQDLLDLIPVPKCDNCGFYEAILECSVCNEVYCQQCWDQVHFGGRRKTHEFRALFDFYHKRIDYGDGDFPSKWPSEIIQDEVQGWMLRVAPIRDPVAIHVNSWEEYNELEQDGSAGRVFYFNRDTFEASYDLPPEVKEDLDNKKAWEDYYAEQSALDFSAEYGGFGGGPTSVPRKWAASGDPAYEYDEGRAAVAAQRSQETALLPSARHTGRSTGRISMVTNPPPPKDNPPESSRTSFMATQLSKIGATPRDTNPSMSRSPSMNNMLKAQAGGGLNASARGKQELSQTSKRKAARAASKANNPLGSMFETAPAGGGMMATTGSVKPSLVDRRTTPRM